MSWGVGRLLMKKRTAEKKQGEEEKRVLVAVSGDVEEKIERVQLCVFSGRQRLLTTSYSIFPYAK